MWRLLGFALVGWASCAATMGIGMAIAPIGTALVAHAVLAPVWFVLLSLRYFRRLDHASPLVAAGVFVAFAAGLDVLVVGLVVNRSLAMFASLLGTWVPLASIFLATYATGLALERRRAGRDRRLA